MKSKKSIYFIFYLLIIGQAALAQTPQAFKYQTVVRNATGEILGEQNVSFRFAIHETNPAGIIVYSEIHSATTNEFGLASLNIGSGVPVSGNFTAIDWGNGSKFLEVELDPSGGSSYVSMGTSQLLSVPFALFSQNTANNNDADADPANELQTLTIDGNNLSISAGNTVSLPGSGINNRIADDDGDTWIDVERTGDNDSIIFTTFGMERMRISNNGYVQVSGQVIATGFQGDGSGLTGIPGDDLGDHTATGDLNMNGNTITNLDDPQQDSDAANKGYVDAHPGDNLGNHTATQNLAIGNNWISNDGNIEGIHIDTDGNVGINNAIPDQELTVSGNIRSTDQVFAGFGTSSSASYRFGTGYENSGLSSPVGNSVAVITDGAQRMIVTQNGNIGIGTNNPEKNLHIQGTFRLADGSQANGRILTSDAFGTAYWSEPSSIVQNQWHTTGNAGTVPGTHFIGTTDAQDLNFCTNNILRARISQKGQIEIYNTGESVFIGEGAGASDDLSYNQNVFIGYQAGIANTTGHRNTANGYMALKSNTTGSNNSAYGYWSLYQDTTGSSNTANGVFSLWSNTTGDANTAFGGNSLYSNTTGHHNTAVGTSSLANNFTGNYNTAIGFMAGMNLTSGSNNTFLGNNVFSDNNNRQNCIALGGNSNLDFGSDNSVRIGNASMTSIGGQVGWTTISDKRIKTTLKTNVEGLNFIMRLEPLTYTYEVEKEYEMMRGRQDTTSWDSKYDIEKIQFSGFFAQDVEQAALEAGYSFSGVDKPKDADGLWGLRYAEFVVPLVKAVQEQQQMIDNLRSENEVLKNEIDIIKQMIINK